MYFHPAGNSRLVKFLEKRMAGNLFYHSLFWQVSGLFLGTIVLGACGNPAASTTAALPANPTASTAPATATSEPTPQTPPPGIDNVIPKPASAVATGGTFRLSASTGIYVDPATDEIKAIGQYLADHLNPATGFALKVQAATGAPAKGIYLSLSGADPALGPEGYQLTITPEQVRLAANQPAGLFYGVQTIRQLLPPAIDSSSVQPGPWIMGTGTISDAPRFAWRGAMLDVARHFFSVADVTRYIDLLAYYKINRLHLHLSDDQGWRIQIKAWPNLTVYGSSLEVGGTPGGYYSQDDYTYIVNYAKSRYITIIPEIDMPGHINAALASYPELTCDGVAPAPYTGTSSPGVSLCVSKDITYTFLENVIGELAALTPGPYIHIGGDEAQGTSTPDYVNFMERVQSIVQASGKQAIGWEEITQSQLLPGTIAQHWNLPTGPYTSVEQQAVQQDLLQAAQKGTKVILSSADKAYLDMKYQDATTLGLTWAGDISVETAYNWDPASLIAGITEKDILGVEAPLWSETLNNLNDLEYMAFPRMLGIAEIGWTPQAGRDWNEYKTRLAAQGTRLEALGVNFYASPEINWLQK
jgi:hexosaminidase